MAKGRKTGGRTAGTPNKATREVREAAQQYVPDALSQLHKIMQTSDSDSARVSAAREILDRAVGKPAQAITGGSDGEPPVVGNKASDLELAKSIAWILSGAASK